MRRGDDSNIGTTAISRSAEILPVPTRERTASGRERARSAHRIGTRAEHEPECDTWALMSEIMLSTCAATWRPTPSSEPRLRARTSSAQSALPRSACRRSRASRNDPPNLATPSWPRALTCSQVSLPLGSAASEQGNQAAGLVTILFSRRRAALCAAEAEGAPAGDRGFARMRAELFLTRGVALSDRKSLSRGSRGAPGRSRRSGRRRARSRPRGRRRRRP
jgi:hypothetical protein